MTGSVSVVIPARNEAGTIHDVITNLSRQDWVDEVVVVDNASTDDTAEAARAAGARAIHEARPGMGHALRTGISAARNDWIMKVDADLRDFDISLFANMAAARADGVGLIKGNWHDPANNMLMTRLLVRPFLRRRLPGLAGVAAPNSGLYLLDRRCIAHHEITGSYAADLDIMLRVHAAGAAVRDVDIGRIDHAQRDLDHYGAQAETIMDFLLDTAGHGLTEEIVVLVGDGRDLATSGLGHCAVRARAGAIVTIFVRDPDDAVALLLREAFAAYPTVSLLPLSQSGAFTPRGPERRLCLLAPHPGSHDPAALRAAIALRARLLAERVEACELLLMPVTRNGAPPAPFHADFAFDVSKGVTIRQRVRDRLSTLGRGTGGAFGHRETFQSFGSLPSALRQDLTGVPAEAAAQSRAL
ncbi:glycosyltransferase family 2 protein [Roseovarius aestuariivivens]|uniref:glycosyltransferase family 2 protein n=1 Tax=Roseovarius aestuariivivens TaxID=1888910 RepID=UPI00107FE059|nr:glycosyltransferase [Roseovarius aestuariivivens]